MFIRLHLLFLARVHLQLNSPSEICLSPQEKREVGKAEKKEREKRKKEMRMPDAHNKSSSASFLLQSGRYLSLETFFPQVIHGIIGILCALNIRCSFHVCVLNKTTTVICCALLSSVSMISCHLNVI